MTKIICHHCYKSDAYVPNKASGRFRYLKAYTFPSLTDPNHRQWVFELKLRLFVVIMISGGIERIYDRNWPSLSNIITLWRTQYKICGNWSVYIPFGLMTGPHGSSLNVKRCLPPMAVTTTPFCQRQRHPHYYSLLCSMVQNIADFLSCRIVLYVFLTDRYIG